MKTAILVFLPLALVSAIVENDKPISEMKKNKKRGVAFFGAPSFDVFGIGSTFGATDWAPTNFGTSGWDSSGNSDLALGQIQLQANHNIALQALKSHGTPSIAYPPEVIQAIHQAKDANHNVFLAQQRVGEAKQAALIQQKIALTKDAVAREAAQRSEQISASARAEATASAKQLVAAQQRLATLKESVAAAQRVAAAREVAAAVAIQKTASETAAELRKQDADKQINQSEEEAREKDIVAAKENAIANALHHAAAEKPAYHPWG